MRNYVSAIREQGQYYNITAIMTYDIYEGYLIEAIFEKESQADIASFSKSDPQGYQWILYWYDTFKLVKAGSGSPSPTASGLSSPIPSPSPSPTPDPVEISLSFSPSSVVPLHDKQWHLETDAARTTLTITATRGGKPASGLKVHLVAGFVPHSGGHDHDETNRPKGAFYYPNDLGSAADFTTDGSGQAAIVYRSSGIGGTDTITATAASAEAKTIDLPVTFQLTSMLDPGPEDHYRLVGQTNDHPSNHNCTVATVALMTRMAAAYQNFYPGGTLLINDQSLPDGGPFDLGPNYGYGAPFWSLTESHFNHREGDSTDIPLGNRKWSKEIKKLGGSIYVESTHWHITTR